MRILTNFIERVGSDKIIHMAVGGWIEQYLGTVGQDLGGDMGCIIAMLIGLPLIYFLSWIKEKYLDDKQDSPFDKKDINWAMFGAGVSFIITTISILIL